MSIFKEKKGFFGSLGEKISNTLFAKMEVDEEVIDNLEELLVSSDIGRVGQDADLSGYGRHSGSDGHQVDGVDDGDGRRCRDHHL